MFEIVYESIWRWKLARRRAGGEKHKVRKLSFRGVFHFRAKKKEKRENDEPPIQLEGDVFLGFEWSFVIG